MARTIGLIIKEEKKEVKKEEKIELPKEQKKK